MIYKATLILSLLFFTLSGSAQSDAEGTPSSSDQPQPSLSSVMQTGTPPTQICPSGGPPTSLPMASDGASSSRAHWHGHTRPTDCQPYSANSTATMSFQQPPSGVPSSAIPDPSLATIPAFTTGIPNGCQPYTIPTGTETVPPFSSGSVPTATPSLDSQLPYTTTPTTTMSVNGTQPDNSTPGGTGSPQSASSSGPIQQGPPISTETATYHVGRRRLVRRQV